MAWLAGLPDWIKFVLILVVFLIVYVIYMMINYNRVKNQVLMMQNSLKVNDMVMTQSGLYGTIQSLNKNTAELKIAENMVILIDRFSIKNKIEDPKKLQE